jgi:hypothetical protein
MPTNQFPEEVQMKYIVTVRGRLKELDEKRAQVAHDTTFERLSAVGQSFGSLGHQTYLNPQDGREFLAIDTWESLEGLQKFMNDPANPGAAIAALFEDQPEITVWAASGWKSL